MNGVSFQSETDKERIGIEDLLHLGKDGNTSTSSAGNRVYSVYFTDCARSCLVSIGRDRDEEAVTTVMWCHLDSDTLGCDSLYMTDKQLGNLFPFLVGNKSHGDLCEGF